MSDMQATAPVVPLACREVVEILTAYAEGVLDAATSARVRWHLALCPGCEIYLQQLTATALTLAALPLEPLPEETSRGLVSVYRDWVASGRGRRCRRALWSEPNRARSASAHTPAGGSSATRSPRP